MGKKKTTTRAPAPAPTVRARQPTKKQGGGGKGGNGGAAPVAKRQKRAAAAFKKCLRCDETYDPAHIHAKSCRMPHPEAAVQEVGARKCYAQYWCAKCHREWDEMDEDRGWCYEGPHESSKAKVDAEGWDDDWEDEDYFAM